MKITEDPWTLGLMADGVFSGPIAMSAALKIHDERGTEYERQTYAPEEIAWACQVLGKPLDHLGGAIQCGCHRCMRKRYADRL